MIPFLTNLPTPIDHDAQDFYGAMTEANKAKALYVVHITAGSPHDGSGTHNWMHTNPTRYRWQRTVGTGGQMWRCTGGRWGLPGTLRVGAHDAGINSFSVGCEHTGNCGTDFRDWAKMLNASARDVAEFGLHVKKARPSRGKPAGSGWVIGHIDDQHYGGTSLHVDPTCGKSAPPPWSWPDYMDLVDRWYDHLSGEGEDVMNEAQEKKLDKAVADAAAAREASEKALALVESTLGQVGDKLEGLLSGASQGWLGQPLKSPFTGPPAQLGEALAKLAKADLTPPPAPVPPEAS